MGQGSAALRRTQNNSAKHHPIGLRTSRAGVRITPGALHQGAYFKELFLLDWLPMRRARRGLDRSRLRAAAAGAVSFHSSAEKTTRTALGMHRFRGRPDRRSAQGEPGPDLHAPELPSTNRVPIATSGSEQGAGSRVHRRCAGRPPSKGRLTRPGREKIMALGARLAAGVAPRHVSIPMIKRLLAISLLSVCAPALAAAQVIPVG